MKEFFSATLFYHADRKSTYVVDDMLSYSGYESMADYIQNNGRLKKGTIKYAINKYDYHSEHDYPWKRERLPRLFFNREKQKVKRFIDKVYQGKV